MVSWDGVVQTADTKLAGFSPIVGGVAAVAILRDANPNERPGSPDCAVPAGRSANWFAISCWAYRPIVCGSRFPWLLPPYCASIDGSGKRSTPTRCRKGRSWAVWWKPTRRCLAAEGPVSEDGGAAGKVIVFGLYQRDGQVLTFPVSGRNRAEILPLLLGHTHPGSLYYTDDWHAYTSLSVRGNHVVISKVKGQPKGRDHINGIEGFWSYAKHWLYQYRGAPRTTFHLYLKEIEFRFNHRDENLVPYIMKLLSRCTR